MSIVPDPAGGPRIAVVLDDPTSAAGALSWASALAQGLHRDLVAVYVESTLAMAAAALPITRVLAHAASGWTAYGPADLARAHRLQVARLAEMLRHASEQHHIHSSLQVVRSTLPHAAMAFDGGSDLVLVSAAALSSPRGQALRCRSVLVWADDSDHDPLLQRVAAQCAASLGVAQRLLRGDAQIASALQAIADLLVVPRSRASAALLERARGPVLLVGGGKGEG